MWGEMLATLFFLLSALAVSLRKFYLESPVIEPSTGQANPALRRRTVKSTKREHILSGLLITVAVICFSLFSVMAAAYLPRIAHMVLLSLTLFFVFFYLPGKNSGRFIMDLASLLTPLFITLLNKTKKQTKGLEERFSERKKLKTTNKHLTKKEILEILNQQKTYYDGRSLAQGLGLAVNFIGLSSSRVEDFMLPLADVHLVGVQETAGPILIDELHKSGYQIFPVNSKEEGIIGSVRLSDLVDLNEGGKPISEVLVSDLQYVYEDDSVTVVLETFAVSGATMLVVRNASKNTGVLYLEDIVSKIVAI